MFSHNIENKCHYHQNIKELSNPNARDFCSYYFLEEIQNSITITVQMIEEKLEDYFGLLKYILNYEIGAKESLKNITIIFAKSQTININEINDYFEQNFSSPFESCIGLWKAKYFLLNSQIFNKNIIPLRMKMKSRDYSTFTVNKTTKVAASGKMHIYNYIYIYICNLYY